MPEPRRPGQRLGPLSLSDRRTFLKGVAAASAVAVTPGRSLASVAEAADFQAPRSWHPVPCRLCGVGCGLLVGVDRGRAVGVRGDPDSPVSQGLGCVKGYHAGQSLYGGDRITRALIRQGGVLVAVPTARALDLVAERLRETRARHGPDSIALYGSAQWSIPDAYVAAKLFKGAIGTPHVETSARLHSASAMTGLETTFGMDGSLGSYQDLDHADVFVLWDTNLAESDPVLFSRMLERRRRNPAVRIIDVATRTTRTGYAADRSLLLAPHSALALANGLCHELVARGWVRRDFLDRHVVFRRGRTEFPPAGAGEGAGLLAEQELEASWPDWLEFLEAYDAAGVARWTGMAETSIRWLASIYGDPSLKVLTVWGPSLNADIRGTWCNNALYNIHLLTGKIASPGNGALSLTGQPNGGGRIHEAGCLADGLPGGTVQNQSARRQAAEIWQLAPEQIGAQPGRTALSMFRALESGGVRFLWIQGTNPMLSLPDLDRQRRALARPDRFVVVSEAYPTPTTELADVVLPAALWLEREGVYGSVERRLQHFDPLVTPPGEAAGDADHMIAVAERLGFGELFPPRDRNRTAALWREYTRFHAGTPSELPPFELLRQPGGAVWPHVEGREVLWRYSTAHDPLADAAQGPVDFYGHPDHRARIWLRPYQPPAEVPGGSYPFWLVTGPVLEHFGGGGMTSRIPVLQRAVPRAYAELHLEDARALGIRNRDRVRLVSRRATIELEARIDFRSQPPRGQVFVPYFDRTIPVHRLMSDAACPLSGQPDGRKCAVRLERAGRGGGTGP